MSCENEEETGQHMVRVEPGRYCAVVGGSHFHVVRTAAHWMATQDDELIGELPTLLQARRAVANLFASEPRPLERTPVPLRARPFLRVAVI